MGALVATVHRLGRLWIAYSTHSVMASCNCLTSFDTWGEPSLDKHQWRLASHFAWPSHASQQVGHWSAALTLGGMKARV
jgi:hypothetical protein